MKRFWNIPFMEQVDYHHGSTRYKMITYGQLIIRAVLIIALVTIFIIITKIAD